MVIKIDDIKEDSIDIIDSVLREYIDSIKTQMFTTRSLSNPNNILNTSGLYEEIDEIVVDQYELVNSYLENVLISLDKSLLDYKKFKNEDKTN